MKISKDSWHYRTWLDIVQYDVLLSLFGVYRGFNYEQTLWSISKDRYTDYNEQRSLYIQLVREGHIPTNVCQYVRNLLIIIMLTSLLGLAGAMSIVYVIESMIGVACEVLGYTSWLPFVSISVGVLVWIGGGVTLIGGGVTLIVFITLHAFMWLDLSAKNPKHWLYCFLHHNIWKYQVCANISKLYNKMFPEKDTKEKSKPKWYEIFITYYQGIKEKTCIKLDFED